MFSSAAPESEMLYLRTNEQDITLNLRKADIHSSFPLLLFGISSPPSLQMCSLFRQGSWESLPRCIMNTHTRLRAHHPRAWSMDQVHVRNLCHYQWISVEKGCAEVCAMVERGLITLASERKKHMRRRKVIEFQENYRGAKTNFWGTVPATHKSHTYTCTHAVNHTLNVCITMHVGTPMHMHTNKCTNTWRQELCGMMWYVQLWLQIIKNDLGCNSPERYSACTHTHTHSHAPVCKAEIKTVAQIRTKGKKSQQNNSNGDSSTEILLKSDSEYLLDNTCCCLSHRQEDN